MSNLPLIAALALAILFGAALLVTLMTERRRRAHQHRLAALAGMPQRPAAAGGTPSLVRRQRLDFATRSLRVLPGVLRGRLATAFAATGGTITPFHLLATAVMAAAGASGFSATILGLDPALVLAIAGLAALVSPFAVLAGAQRRYQKRFLDLFPDALDLIVRAVRSGLPALDAMEAAAQEIPAPVGTELQRAIDEMRIGVEMEEAMRHTADRVRVPDFRFFVVTLVLQRRTGGALAEALSNLSTVIRRRRDLRLKGRALSSEAKASAAVLGALPVLSGGALVLLNPGYISLLVTDPRGRFIFGMAVLSLVTGLWVMNAIIKRALR